MRDPHPHTDHGGFVTPQKDREQRAPSERDDLIEQSESERNDLRRQGAHQASPETEQPERATADERLEHSAAAAGMERSEEQNAPTREASVRAFEESRGSSEPRETNTRD